LKAAAGAPAVLRAQARASRPNILLIVADDLGYGDLGCYGQTKIQTPNIDRMAAEGTRFTQAYAGSTVCAPSRCSLFTGKHTGHAQMRGNTQDWVRKSDVMISDLLKQAGYTNALIGKWSLGTLGTEANPPDRGFDEWYGYLSQMHAHTYYPQNLLHNRGFVDLPKNWSGKPSSYAPDLFTERAVQWMEKVNGPFFMHLAYTIPHANNELGNATGNGMEVPEDAPYGGRDWPQVEKNFAAMVSRLDRDVGRVLETLKRRGLDRDTLVLFTSDNGPHKEGGHNAEFFQSSGPLRGTKRAMYDGGIRVPAIARWPGVVPDGRTSDFVWAFWDVLPTCCELAGVSAPTGIDGQSIVPALQGKTQAEHEFLYWEFHEGGFAQGVRHKNWKAARYGLKGPLELYDVGKDLGERDNVAARHPEVVKRIEAYLATARTEHPGYPVKERKPA
jgi:arylsulfatase A-like enzyme